MNRKAVDMAGQRFNRWTVVARAENSPSGQIRWLCRCDCGTEAVVQSGALKSDHSKSCGCHKVETTIRRSTKHGHAAGGVISPTYHSWAGMIARCGDPKHSHFARYGGRGIAVCERWLEFTNFLADMGEKPPGSTIDRRENDRGYEPGNCRWATAKTQARNKSTNRRLTVDGRSRTVAEWAELTGVKASVISERPAASWSDENAVMTPAGAPDKNRRSRLITHQGETLHLEEWSRRIGKPSSHILRRLAAGFSVADALNPGKLKRRY